MEQKIIDASKYKISIHSLDSRFAETLNKRNSDFRIYNPAPLKNIVRVRLATLELPLVEYTFSKLKGNNTFLLGSTTITLPEGNYTALGLCSAIQNLAQVIDPSFLCELDPISQLVHISSTSSFTIDFTSTNINVADRVTHWGLGYYLGFRMKVLNGSDTYIGNSPINIQPTSYYLIQLYCPDSVVNVSHHVYYKGAFDAFAKVVLKNNAYQIQFDDASSLLRNEYTFISPINIPFFQVRLLDPWGDEVNMMSTEWSITLELTEIVNSKTHGELIKTYNR